MENNYTPGPWTCRAISSRVLNHNRVFEIRGFETKKSVRDVLENEIEANAKLIDAAPDLLEALQNLLAFVETPGIDNRYTAAAHHAINKAIK